MPETEKTVCKAKKSCRPKAYFLLVRFIKPKFVKNFSGIFLKSQRKTVKPMKNCQILRKSSRHVKPQNLNKATVCRWLSGLSASLCNFGYNVLRVSLDTDFGLLSCRGTPQLERGRAMDFASLPVFKFTRCYSLYFILSNIRHLIWFH